MKPQCLWEGGNEKPDEKSLRLSSSSFPWSIALRHQSPARVTRVSRLFHGKYEAPKGGGWQSLDSVNKKKKCFIRYPESYFCGWRDATNGNTPTFIGQYPGTHEFSYESKFFFGHNQRTLNMTATGANKNSAITSCNLTS